MRLFRLIVASTLAVGATIALSRAQSTVSLREGSDSYQHVAALIRADSTSQNSGARDQLIIGKTSGAVRAVFSFGLSSIPPGSTITSATLSVWTDAQSSTATGTVGTLELHRLTATPVEGTGTTSGGAGTGVTWLSLDGQTGTGHSWTTAGGDYDAAILSSVPGFNALIPNAQKTFASTSAFVAALQSALDQGQPLNLLAMAPTTEAGSDSAYTRLSSDDSTETAQRPLLTVTFTTPAFVAPASLTAKAASWSTATLGWNLASADATGFTIERRTGANGEWTTVMTAAPGTTTFTDAGLSAATSYAWRIKALYPSGESGYCTSADITTPAAVTRPPLVVMPLGDSITQGTLAGGYRAPLYTAFTGSGYTVRFVGSQTSSPTTALTNSGNHHHEGHGGFSIQQIYDNLDGGTSNGGHWLDGITGTRDPVYPDVILLMIGTNDLGMLQREVSDTLASYDALLTKLATLRPSALIIASTLIPYTGTTYPLRELHQLEFNAALPDLIAAHRASGERVWLYDMRTKVFPQHIDVDGVHPNQSGYDAIATGWFEGFGTLPLIENWRLSHFGTAADTATTANLADPDGDSVNNLSEYAFGGDPTNAASRILPTLETAADTAGAAHLQISFPRRRGGELAYRVQTSSDLAGTPAWQDGGVQINAPVALNDDYEQVTYRDPSSLAEAPRRFMRVQVTAP